MATALIPPCSMVYSGSDLEQGARKVGAPAWSAERFPKGLLRDVSTSFQDGVHLFACSRVANFIASCSFLVSLLLCSTFLKKCLWVSQNLTRHENGALAGSGLCDMGLDPERILFVQVGNASEVLWVLEQALVSGALGMVIGELHDDRGILDIKSTRRLNLRSYAAGMPVHLVASGQIGATAALTRWAIHPVLHPTVPHRSIGWPSWRMDLNKNKKGQCGHQIVTFDPVKREFFSLRLRSHEVPSPRHELSETGVVALEAVQRRADAR